MGIRTKNYILFKKLRCDTNSKMTVQTRSEENTPENKETIKATDVASKPLQQQSIPEVPVCKLNDPSCEACQ